MTMNVALGIIFVLFLIIFILVLLKSNEKYKKIYLNEKKSEEVKNCSQPINVELIDIFLNHRVDVYRKRNGAKTDIYYVVRDINTNKMYCVFGDHNPDQIPRNSNYTTNALFTHSWKAIREGKKIIGYQYTAIIKNLDNNKDIKLNDMGQLWIIENGVTNSLLDTIKDEKLLNKAYIGNLNYECYLKTMSKKLNKLLNLNTNNDYTILNECEFISGVIEFK